MAPERDGVDAQPRAARRRARSFASSRSSPTPRSSSSSFTRTTSARSASRSRAPRRSSRCSTSSSSTAGAARRRGDRHRHGAPRAPQRARERARTRTSREIFAAFDDKHPERFLGGGDVKYHLGYSSDRVDRVGRQGPPLAAFNPSHLEFVNPVVEGRVRAKQDRTASGRSVDAAPHPRRRGVHGPGRRRRDAEPRRARGLLDGRHDPPRRQQPDWLHDAPRGRALDALLHRHHADDEGPRLPRERRGPRGGHPGDAPRHRVPPAVRQGRRHRHVLLPPLRPQRGRRAALHAAGDVRAHRSQADGARGLRAPPRRGGALARRRAPTTIAQERQAVLGRRARRGAQGRLPPAAERASEACGAAIAAGPDAATPERPTAVRRDVLLEALATMAKVPDGLPREPQGAQAPRAAAASARRKRSRSTGAPPSTSPSRRCSLEGNHVRLSRAGRAARHVQPSPRGALRHARPASRYTPLANLAPIARGSVGRFEV